MKDLGAVNVARQVRDHGRATFTLEGGSVIDVRAEVVPVELDTAIRYRCIDCDGSLVATMVEHMTTRAAEIAAWLRSHDHRPTSPLAILERLRP